jgi:flagellar assembly factor FliW
MPTCATKYFGTLDYVDHSVFTFPQGLPAFSEEKSFVLIELPEHAPLVFLQSLTHADLCFLAFPVLVADRDYQLDLSPEDLETLQFSAASVPRLGEEVLVLALVSLHDNLPATANLMAPIVANLKVRCAVQAIRQDSRYSHQHAIDARVPAEIC